MTAKYVERRKQWIKSRRQWRKLTRRARLRRQILRYLLLALLLFAGVESAICIPWSLNNHNENVVVHGNYVVTKDQILQVISGHLQRPIYRIDPKKLELKIENLEAVKYAFVRRYAFPRPTLIVDILEEVPWASFATSPSSPLEAVISQTGRMIPVREFPAITRPKLMIYGEPNCKLTQSQVFQWASLCAYINKLTGAPVESVDMRKREDIRVKDGDYNLRLGTADSTIAQRISRLTSILSTVEPMKDKLEYIDLGLDNNVPLKLAKNSQSKKP